MRVERALEIVRNAGHSKRRTFGRPFHRAARVMPPMTREYQPSPRPWSWETGNPKERADMVRSHYRIPNLTGEVLCELFSLTINGLVDIARGSDWKPEHVADTPPRSLRR